MYQVNSENSRLKLTLSKVSSDKLFSTMLPKLGVGAL